MRDAKRFSVATKHIGRGRRSLAGGPVGCDPEDAGFARGDRPTGCEPRAGRRTTAFGLKVGKHVLIVSRQGKGAPYFLSI